MSKAQLGLRAMIAFYAICFGLVGLLLEDTITDILS